MSGCGGCALAAARRAGKNLKYVWTGANGETIEYEKEQAARAKVHRKGGSYKIKEG